MNILYNLIACLKLYICLCKHIIAILLCFVIFETLILKTAFLNNKNTLIAKSKSNLFLCSKLI